jgi:hypothetical protein
MATLICSQDFNTAADNSRLRLVSALRAALNAAEQGENEVTIYYEKREITWNFEDGEFFVINS